MENFCEGTFLILVQKSGSKKGSLRWESLVEKMTYQLYKINNKHIEAIKKREAYKWLYEQEIYSNIGLRGTRCRWREKLKKKNNNYQI